MSELAGKVRDFVVAEFGLKPESVADETLLFSSGMLDSFALVALLGFVEQASGRRFRVAEVNLDNLDSIDRIVRFVARQP